MNFLFITFDFHPSVGGIETRIKNYVKYLVKMGHNVTVVHLLNPSDQRRYLGSTTFSSAEQLEGATVLRYRFSFLSALRILGSSIRAARFYKSDVLHVFTGANTFLGLLLLVLSRLSGKNVGMSIFGKDLLASRPNKFFYTPLILSMFVVKRLSVNSKATLKLIPKVLRGKARILYPGVDKEWLQPHQSIVPQGNKDKRILFVGRLVRRKGPEDLVEAFKAISERRKEAKLVIVGDGPFRQEVVSLVNRLGLSERVEFKGMLVGAKLWEEYAMCDLFVMPSRRTDVDVEGFGMVFLEAGLFGKPCVGTWSGGIPDAVIHGETGILVEQKDIGALKDAIEMLIDNKELARTLGEQGRKRVLAEFSWSKATERFLEMYI